MLDTVDDMWIDILTGHAAARFKYVDVRNKVDFERQPPRWPVLHIPLRELRTRAPKMLEPGAADIVVYGSTDTETQAAQDSLEELGFKKILGFEGGFEALRAAGLA